MGIYNEKEVYVTISKFLIEGETIKFDLLRGCATAYYLEDGCTLLGLPPKTMVVYKPCLIWDTQHRVKMSGDEREDIDYLLLIYGETHKGDDYEVKPERFLGKMETMSYDFFNALGKFETNITRRNRFNNKID